MKKKLDIEKLIQWALREEMPKGRRISISPWDMISKFGALGTVVQSSNQFDVESMVPGEPHDDAIKISAAIKSLGNVARFNHREDVAVLFGDWVSIATDAMNAIFGAVFTPRDLIISHGVMGSRPCWEHDQPIAYPLRDEFINLVGEHRERIVVVGIDENGERVELQANRGRKAMREGQFDFEMLPRCPLVWENPSLISIGHDRAEYFAWHGALVELCNSLKGTLAEFEPEMTILKPMPWITGQCVSRVLDDGLPPGLLTGRLGLIPKRHAPGMPVESEIERKSRPDPKRLKLALEIKARKMGLSR